MSDSLDSILFDFFLEGESNLGTLSLEEASAFAPLSVDCAWCLQEAGLPLGSGSHGICAEHAEAVRTARRGTRGRRRG